MVGASFYVGHQLAQKSAVIEATNLVYETEKLISGIDLEKAEREVEIRKLVEARMKLPMKDKIRILFKK